MADVEPPTTPPEDPAALAAEVERLRTERDSLAAEASKLDRRVHGGRGRSLAVGILVVLSVLSFLTASLGVWVNRNLLETDVWIERVGPLAEDPAVQKAMANAITNEVMKVVQPKEFFESILPEKGQLLAIPLTSALRTFVNDRVLTFVESERFQKLWLHMQETAHRTAVNLLRNEPTSPMVNADDGTLTVSIIPAIDAVLERISELSPEILGRTVEIPELQVEDLPDTARAALSKALGVELDSDFGVITVYDGDALSSSQQAIKIFDKLLVPAIVLTFLLTAAALFVSRRRRRTGLQLLVGFALTLVLIRRAMLRLTTDVIDLIKVPGNKAAAESILNASAEPLLQSTEWILTGFAVIIAILLLTGPYRWAVALRQGVARLFRGTVAAANDPARQDATVAWVHDHAIALQWAGGALFVAALWWWNLSWLGLLLLMVVIGAAELWVRRVADDDTDGEGPGDAGDRGDDGVGVVPQPGAP